MAQKAPQTARSTTSNAPITLADKIALPDFPVAAPGFALSFAACPSLNTKGFELSAGFAPPVVNGMVVELGIVGAEGGDGGVGEGAITPGGVDMVGAGFEGAWGCIFEVSIGGVGTIPVVGDGFVGIGALDTGGDIVGAAGTPPAGVCAESSGFLTGVFITRS